MGSPGMDHPSISFLTLLLYVGYDGILFVELSKNER